MPRKERSNAMGCSAHEGSSPRSFSYLFLINNPALMYVFFPLRLPAISQREFFSLAQQSSRAQEVRLGAAHLGRGVINLLNHLLKASPPVHLHRSTFQPREAIGRSSSLTKRFISVSLLLESKAVISHPWLLYSRCWRKRLDLCTKREAELVNQAMNEAMWHFLFSYPGLWGGSVCKGRMNTEMVNSNCTKYSAAINWLSAIFLQHVPLLLWPAPRHWWISASW